MIATSDARRLLGAIPTLLKVGFASAVAYRSEFIVWILATNMPLVMLLLWTAVAKDGPVGRFGEKEFVAYFLVTLLVRLLTGAWVVWELNMEVRQGTLGQRLLRPIHPMLSYAADNLAALPIRAFVAVPLAVIAIAVVGQGRLTHDPVQWIVTPVAIAGAWLLTFCAMYTIGSLSLFFESSLAVYDLWLGLFFVFAGYLMPLELLPGWLQTIARASPFAYVLAFPVETILGLSTRAACLRALAAQWAYVALFFFLALALWKRGIARYSAYGG